MESKLIDGTFKIEALIGSGSFGELHKGVNIKTGEEVAIKIEKKIAIGSHLFYENEIYKTIQGDGFPKVHFFGEMEDNHVIVMTLLGETLETLFQKNQRKLSLKSVLMLAVQMIDRIAFIHALGFLHRDIKPENFLIGKVDPQTIYLVDFGLAKKYQLAPGQHIPYKDQKKLVGTSRYASVNTHIGVEQGRRDDLESLGYVLIRCLQGKLPWEDMKGTSKEERRNKIKKSKMDTSVEALCHGLPGEFAVYMNYIKNLSFEENPEYLYLKALFKNLLFRSGFKNDGMFEWNNAKKSTAAVVAEQAGSSIGGKMVGNLIKAQ